MLQRLSESLSSSTVWNIVDESVTTNFATLTFTEFQLLNIDLQIGDDLVTWKKIRITQLYTSLLLNRVIEIPHVKRRIAVLVAQPAPVLSRRAAPALGTSKRAHVAVGKIESVAVVLDRLSILLLPVGATHVKIAQPSSLSRQPSSASLALSSSESPLIG